MNELVFLQLEKENKAHIELFGKLLVPYFYELDTNLNADPVTPQNRVLEYARGMVNMQGPVDRHLEVCFHVKKPIGFVYGKVDHEDHRGFIKPGYGFIMEFYVIPEFRRQGVGKQMCLRIEEYFRNDKVPRVYLTSDPVTGIPFWLSMGYEHLGEISPENNQQIFEKCL